MSIQRLKPQRVLCVHLTGNMQDYSHTGKKHKDLKNK
jgi:hypothetical protein